MERIFFALLFCLHTACSSDGHAVVDTRQARTDSVAPVINPSGKTLATRFPAPKGYARVLADSTSFATYLRRFPLLPDGSQVLLYNGRPKARQNVHAAVLDIDIGKRNLQQCADAVMRLRAEYLFVQKRYGAIHFNFSNGFRAEYARWRQGERIRVDGKRVYWVGGGTASGTYKSFRAYLDMVFAYAGSASLERELHPVEPAKLRAGDVWIQGGYPGHAVIIVDVAEQPETGERLFLLAQSYMPAQQIHVLRNPAGGSPWYSSLALEDGLQTPEWNFAPGQLRRFLD